MFKKHQNLAYGDDVANFLTNFITVMTEQL